MSKLCYPYGSGITCVCDTKGRIYKCFPEIDADGQVQDSSSQEQVAHSLIDSQTGTEDLLDGSTEIVLATTFLVLVILVFIGFVLYRCEKSILRQRMQENLSRSCNHHRTDANLISVSIQTEPLIYHVSHSNTIPRISNGSAKTGLTSLYNGTGNGSLPSRYVAPPLVPPNYNKPPSPERPRSVDHFLNNYGPEEGEDQAILEERNGISPEEDEECLESEVMMSKCFIQRGGLYDKY